jgi:hypothetical protein
MDTPFCLELAALNEKYIPSYDGLTVVGRRHWVVHILSNYSTDCLKNPPQPQLFWFVSSLTSRQDMSRWIQDIPQNRVTTLCQVDLEKQVKGEMGVTDL